MGTEPNPDLYKFDPTVERTEVLANLASMPTRLREAVAGASDKALQRRPADGDWSAFQTVCHVRDATLAYAARFRWIVFNPDPFLPDYDENNWVESCRDVPADLPAMLNEIAASRSDLIRMLTRLPEDSWQRTGRHEAMGSVVLEHYARHQVVHETMHIEQIAKALAG